MLGPKDLEAGEVNTDGAVVSIEELLKKPDVSSTAPTQDESTSLISSARALTRRKVKRGAYVKDGPLFRAQVSELGIFEQYSKDFIIKHFLERGV